MKRISQMLTATALVGLCACPQLMKSGDGQNANDEVLEPTPSGSPNVKEAQAAQPAASPNHPVAAEPNRLPPPSHPVAAEPNHAVHLSVPPHMVSHPQVKPTPHPGK